MFRSMAVAFVFSFVLIAPVAMADEWVGWITDEHCGAKGVSGSHGSCALRCADRGAALVLYSPADEQIYKLDDQKAARELAGKKVRVVGAKGDGGITVESITEVKAE